MVRGSSVRVAFALWLAVAARPGAALEVRVDDGRGPLADAIVVVDAAGAAAPAASAGPAEHVIDQKDETFVPFLTLMRVGDSIVFRNSDHTRHHVYTFSPVHPFEFVVPSGSTSGAVTFDRAGVAAIGCNIHDRMIAYVFVTDAPYAAQTGADGVAKFPGVPAGAWHLRAWHPRLRAGGKPVEREVTVPSARPVAITLRVDPAPPANDRERSVY